MLLSRSVVRRPAVSAKCSMVKRGQCPEDRRRPPDATALAIGRRRPIADQAIRSETERTLLFVVAYAIVFGGYGSIRVGASEARVREVAPRDASEERIQLLPACRDAGDLPRHVHRRVPRRYSRRRSTRGQSTIDRSDSHRAARRSHRCPSLRGLARQRVRVGFRRSGDDVDPAGQPTG